jgi:hypothetical protein
MRLYGRPVSYHLRQSAGGEEAGRHAHWPSQDDSFSNQEAWDDSYTGQEWTNSDAVDSRPDREWVETIQPEQDWAGTFSPDQEGVGNSYADQEWAETSYPDLSGPAYRQQVLVGRPDVSYPLIPYWTTDRVDQSLVWLTFLTVFLVVFVVALLAGWCLQLLARTVRRRSQVEKN